MSYLVDNIVRMLNQTSYNHKSDKAYTTGTRPLTPNSKHSQSWFFKLFTYSMRIKAI